MSPYSRLLCVFFMMAAAAGFVLARRPYRGDPTPPGRWHPARTPAGLEEPAEEQRARLEALPYLAGTHPAPARSGVTVHVPQLAWRGANLLVSGDAPGATLIDMEGNTLHRWALAPGALWPEYDTQPMKRRARYWRRARLMDDGGVIALYEGAGLARLDADSRPLWSRVGEFHHDFDVDGDGNLHALQRRESPPTGAPGPGGPGRYPLLLDFIVTLDPAGHPIAEISIEECFERSDYAGLIRPFAREGDIFHTNSVSWLDGRLAARSTLFRKGNLLISQRNTGIVAIIDPAARRVVWAGNSPWKRQHDPVLLDTGSILLFDNDGLAGRSRILALDPLSGVVQTVYAGDEAHPFYSETCGTSQPLPNGNTLITESDFGRAFEVTSSGAIVWEYLNPRRAGARNDLVATLFEVTRIDSSRVPPS